jgi:signal transduction histidine kinase
MIQEDHAIAQSDALSREVLETELVLASQMRSLAHVYGVLAHDLKAPLNAMQLALDLLADSLANPEPSEAPAAGERRQRYLTILREELARLDRTLRTMLEQKEPLDSVSGAFDLCEVIQEIGRLLLPQARRQRVEMKLELPPAAARVAGHRERVKQALLNLAIRALEAMPDGGRLAIGCAVQDAMAAVTVEDNGSGLRKSASGIGLYLARLVVESHGGDIVEEVVPEGTRFKLTLPLG